MSPDTPAERYQLDWPGKRQAFLAADTPTDQILRPDSARSVAFDATANLFIEGDNLDALKLLLPTHRGTIALAYIDPPYNTRGDFLYDDDFATGDDPHSAWLSMMVPRLRLTRDLLRDDGCLVIHIDENELANLIKLVEEIFGAKNLLGVIAWDKRNPKGDATAIATQHESIVCVCRDRAAFRATRQLTRTKPNAAAMLRKAAELFARCGTHAPPDDLAVVDRKYKLGLDLGPFATTYDLAAANADFAAWVARQAMGGGEAAYRSIDAAGRVFQAVSMAWPNKKRPADDYLVPLLHPVTGRPCPVPARGWRNPPATMRSLLDRGLIVFGPDETRQPRRKYFLDENLTEALPSVLPFGGSDDDLLQDLGVAFDNPKPVAFARALIEAFAPERDGVVLDFFAGSGTTAHAVMELNAADGGTRRFVLVQRPEPCRPSSAAFAAGFATVADVTLRRLRAAGDRVRRAGTAADVGFRVAVISGPPSGSE